jgi:hypothetical protein
MNMSRTMKYLAALACVLAMSACGKEDDGSIPGGGDGGGTGSGDDGGTDGGDDGGTDTGDGGGTNTGDGGDGTGDGGTDTGGTEECGDPPEGGWYDCVNADDGSLACGLGGDATCLMDNVDDPTMGACSITECTSVCDCWGAPETGTATPACVDILAEGGMACVLECDGDKVCPDGMDCKSAFGDICMYDKIPGTDTGTDTGTGTGGTGTDTGTGS